MRARICLVTTGQPSTNPRLVREADALTAAGCDVRAVGAHVAPWADDSDERVLASRSWRFERIDWRRDRNPALFWKTGLRHRLSTAAAGLPLTGGAVDVLALSRIGAELRRAAAAAPADLYIAHNLGALPAAWVAAKCHGARLGFDAEDFHSGQFPAHDRSRESRVVARVEARFIPACDYVTAASPLIADEYARLRSDRPVCVLNVSPLIERPPARRPAARGGALSLYWCSQTIGPDRGLEDVVRAMGRLAPGTVTLHVRGRWRADYRRVFERVVSESGVGTSSLSSAAPADPGELARLASDHDVGLAVEPGATPNNAIALSNKIFTYLLAGCAIAATETRGQAAVRSALGPAAAWYRPGDVAGLAAILSTWANDRAALDEARRAAWALGGGRFNWDREQYTFLAVVEGVLRRCPKVRAEPTPAAAS